MCILYLRLRNQLITFSTCASLKVTAAPGKGDEVEKVIKGLRDHALGDSEPDNLVYRVSRFNEVRYSLFLFSNKLGG